MSEMRWGVFTRDRQDGLQWHERFRWDGDDLVPLPDLRAAEERARETRSWHPELDVEVRMTEAPLPGTFRESFAEWLEETP